MTRNEGRKHPQRAWPAPWRAMLMALGLSLAGTILLGGSLFLLQPNVWWIAVAGVLSLVGSGVYLGNTTGSADPFDGTLLAIFYFGIVVAILFSGTLTDVLPEPLPGLGIGDSTFFFVWPLLQLAGAVLGSVIGGQWRQQRNRRWHSQEDEAL